MSLPYMQLYPADYLKDTRHLKVEEHGAYLLLLMDIWVAGGAIPNDDEELAERCKLSPERWAAMKPKLLRMLKVQGDDLTSQRITADIEHAESKSRARAIAGAAGGKAKARLPLDESLAIARQPGHQKPAMALASSSDTINQKAATQPAREGAREAPGGGIVSVPAAMLDRCLKAIGLDDWDSAKNRSAGLLQTGPLLTLMQRGYDFEADILAALENWKKGGGRTPKSWAYFLEIVPEYVARRDRIPPKSEPVAEDWAGRMREWAASKEWAPAWGPAPDMPGCRVPAELLAKKGAA